ncbi:MAG: EscJ/YscJ/HrcJ family type III secretion inner membrane ring protein [Simkaniaceae bacterium]|nr:EscJ/YscJ/HrcJ family type III secretion inner membrane ring protein [Simkaniaceae bacterium]
MKSCRWALFSLFMIFALVGCDTQTAVVSNIDEREANIILVLLKSKGIDATKTMMSSSAAGGDSAPKFMISVDGPNELNAVAFLNQNGFPRQPPTTLLDLYKTQGLTSSDREEQIRYQAGLESQIAGMIRMIDGVIDATVQLSFPQESTGPTFGAAVQKDKITAAVYVKHQSLFDDPNAHLETKVKRLVSGSVTGLDLNDVTVVSDRSRFTDITIDPSAENLSNQVGGLVEIWSIGVAEGSKGRFRFIFFVLTLLLLVFAVIAGWLIWKIYPVLRKQGSMKSLLSAKPMNFETKPPEGGAAPPKSS